MKYLEDYTDISIWTSVFSENVPDGHHAIVTIKTKDGTTIEGDLWKFEVFLNNDEISRPRDIALTNARIYNNIKVCNVEKLIINERSIEFLSVKYQESECLTSEKASS